MATATSRMAARPVRTNVRTGCRARARRNRRRSPRRARGGVTRPSAPPSGSVGSTDTGSSSPTETGEPAWECCGARGVVTGFEYTGGLRPGCVAGPSRRDLHLPDEPESVLAPEQLANGLVPAHDRAGLGVPHPGIAPPLRP